MGDYSRAAFGMPPEPIPIRENADGSSTTSDHGWAMTEHDKEAQFRESYAAAMRRYAPSYDHYRQHGYDTPQVNATRYVPDVGLDGFGEPACSYADRQRRAAASTTEQGYGYSRYETSVDQHNTSDTDTDIEDDVTVGELVLGVAALAIFAVGVVTTGRFGLRIIGNLAKLA